MKFWALLAVLAVGAVGCSEDEDKPAVQQGTFNAAAAKSSTSSSVSALRSVALSTDGLKSGGAGAAFSLVSAVGGMSSVITPASGASTASFAPKAKGSTGTVSQAVQTGTCECTETQCTFVDCSDDSFATDGYSYVINGSIGYENGHLFCTNFSFTEGTPYGSFVFGLDCDVQLTSTSIDGTLEMNGSGNFSSNGQNASFVYDVGVTYNDVVWDESSQIVSGSVDVHATVTANGQGYTASGSVTFP